MYLSLYSDRSVFMHSIKMIGLGVVNLPYHYCCVGSMSGYGVGTYLAYMCFVHQKSVIYQKSVACTHN